MSATLAAIAAKGDRQDNNDHSSHARKMTALGELAGGITHDYRNILQTVISTLELIEGQSDDPTEVRRIVASALRAAERGIGLSNRLLAFSRCDATTARPTCVVASLDSVAETLARTGGARMKVQFEQKPDNLWQTIIDPMELELTLINLGINARDAMPNGGRICFGARNVTVPSVDRRQAQRSISSDGIERRGPRLSLPGGDYVLVTVGDTGIGMDAATLARAAEPFFTTKPAGKGTGLGLSMAHALATARRGALRLMSQSGRGTTVELWLPRAGAIANQAGSGTASESDPPSAGDHFTALRGLSPDTARKML
jgi:signal transduction histidine kinase